ncbi:MAG: hypothetical protein OEU95_04665 [Nitrospirota bacterium]|nr:hypothetical protein [Nitrospirota bacterium]
MKFITLENITEGLLTARDIESASGQRLVAKGTVLTRPLINSLKRHNINNVYIEDDSEQNEFTEEEIMFAEEMCRAGVAERFLVRPADPMMETIFKTALRIEAREHLKRKR